MNAYLVLVAVPDAADPTDPGATRIPGVGQTWTLQPGKNILGRQPAPDVGILLPWMIVSRKHAQIELFAAGLWEVVDQLSRNGTAVNGQKLQPHALSPLNDGDRIRIDPIEMVFCFRLDPVPLADAGEETLT